MADIRINSLPTTASASSSDDFLALDGATNGTRKLNAYSPTFGGNLTVSGTAVLSSSVKMGSGAVVALGSQAVVIDAGSEMRLQLNSTDRPGIYFTAAGSNLATLRVNSTAFELLTTSGTPLSINQSTLAATLSGNLTVSGNGLNTFGGTGTTNASILFGASNVANTSAGYLSISQRSNYGYALFGWNMTGTSGSDAYTSPKNATGSAGVELIGGSSGITRFIYSTAATTGGNTLTVTEAARFSSGNFLLGTTTDGGQKLQVAGSAFIGSATSSTNVLTVQGNGPNTTHQAGTSTAALWNRWLNSAGTRRGYYGYASAGDSTFTIMNEENGSFVLGTNNATALTLDSSQNATFAGSIRSNQATNISLTSGVATTIFSLGTSAGVFIVTATLDVNSAAGYAIVGKSGTGSWQVLANSGTQISFSMSTNDLQITQSSGATSTTNTFNLLRLR